MKNLLILCMTFFVLLLGLTFLYKNKALAANYSQVHAAHILVDTEENAKQIKSKIDNGENFRQLAKQYSKCPSGQQGGDLGFFGKGQMVQEFEDAAFATPIGQVSNPVKTQFGWHLIKVYEKK